MLSDLSMILKMITQISITQTEHLLLLTQATTLAKSITWTPTDMLLLNTLQDNHMKLWLLVEFLTEEVLVNWPCHMMRVKLSMSSRVTLEAALVQMVSAVETVMMPVT